MRVLLVFSMNMKPGDSNVLAEDTLKNCEAGLKVWQKESFDKLMVVGGIFCGNSIQTIPASVLMAQWFKERGVAEEKIVIEVESKDTWGNIENTLKILPKNSEITVIAEWQHTMRVALIFRFGHGVHVHLRPAWFFPGLKRFLMEWPYLILTVFDLKGKSYFARRNREKRTFTF